MDKLFIYNDGETYHIIDLFGESYGRGNTPKSALQHAARLGITSDDVEMDELFKNNKGDN